MLRRYGFKATFIITANMGKQGFLTWDEARTMYRMGMSIESHSVTHPVLTRLPLTRVREEMSDSRATIRRELGGDARVFCYPYGQCDARARKLARQAGYVMAFGTRYGKRMRPASVYALPRMAAPRFFDRRRFVASLG